MNLITITDIQKYKPVSSNTNTAKKIDPYILEAQMLDLRKILGDALYFDLVKNWPVPEGEPTDMSVYYTDLMNGKEYTHQGISYTFSGLIPVLAYYAYARYAADSSTEETATGMVTKTNQFSTPVSEKTIARKVDQARSAAFSYQLEMIDFLNRKSTSSYIPLWKSTCPEPKFRRPKITPIG
jgi:hypothetical protein